MLKRAEGRAAALSALYFFLLLFAYFLIRPARDALGIAKGADRLPWLISATLAAMLLVNPLFAAAVSRMPRRRFIPAAYRAAMACLLGCFALLACTSGGLRVGIGYGYFVWLSVFNLFVISVFWAFTSDLFTMEQSRRLFGRIAVGGTLGGIAGSFVAKQLTGTFRFDPVFLLPLGCLPLEGAVQVVRRLSRHAGGSSPDDRRPAARPHTPEPGGGVMDGFRLLVRSPYLLFIAAYVFVYSTTSTFIWLEQGRLIAALYPDESRRAAAFANIDLWSNLLTLGAQLLLTAGVVRLLGVGGTLVVLPAYTLLGFGLLWRSPGLQTLMMFQAVRRALHFAFDRPVRETLYTVLSPNAKYKAKSLIDTFIYRFGDQAGAWLPGWLEGAAIAVPAVAAPLAAIWVVVAVVLGRMQARRASASATGNIPAIE